MWFSLIGLTSELCDGNYYWWRVLLISPFTYITVEITYLIWNHFKT